MAAPPRRCPLHDLIPTWRARDFTGVPVGTPYQWEGTIYKLAQAHDASGNPGWTPFDTGRRMTMRFDTESKEVSNPWKTERENITMKEIETLLEKNGLAG